MRALHLTESDICRILLLAKVIADAILLLSVLKPERQGIAAILYEML